MASKIVDIVLTVFGVISSDLLKASRIKGVSSVKYKGSMQPK